nr:MAG TPA: hypothetical protein [Caudoviricetes sp.]
MAYVAFTDIGITIVGARVEGLDTSYERDDRTITWYVDGKEHSTDSISAGASYSPTMYRTGLKPETSYTFLAIIRYSSTASSGLDSSVSVSGSCTTKAYPDPDPPATRPDTFEWDAAKVSGKKFNLTASEWNKLTKNVNDVRVYKGLGPIAFTSAVSGNTFTAAMYNEVVSAIKEISGYGTSLGTVSSGGKVYAYQLDALRDAVNAVT